MGMLVHCWTLSPKKHVYAVGRSERFETVTIAKKAYLVPSKPVYGKTGFKAT